jgi:hypothetical protein
MQILTETHMNANKIQTRLQSEQRRDEENINQNPTRA